MKTIFRSITLTVLVLLIALGCLDTAMAQNNSISVNPTSLSFCVPANNSPAPAAQTLTVTSNVSTALGFNANATQNWIRLNGVAVPITGNTSSSPTITVTIDPSGYSSGSNVGLIQIQSPPTSLTVPVAVTVTATCTSVTTLSATPNSVSLSATQTTQGVTVSGPSGAQISATPNYGTNNPLGWFSLSTSSLAAGSGLTVFLASSNLTSGTTGSILFQQTNGTSNTVTVPVTFTSTGGTGNGVFNANPSSISQTFTSSLAASQSQTVTLTGPPASLATSVNIGTGPAGWLTATQPAGLTPQTTIQVTVNPANLPTGTTAGSVTLTQNGAPSNFVTIPVSAAVGTGAYNYSPNPLSFAVAGGSATASNQTLTITGPANATVGATAQVFNGGTQWLTFNGSTTTTSGTLTNGSLQLGVSVNPFNLASNQTYTGAIAVTQGNTTVLNIPVTVTTSGAPMLTFTPTQLNFAWQIGTAPPPAQTINVTSPAGTLVNFTPSGSTSTCGTWLVVTPLSQTATNGTTPTPITVQINTVGLPSTTTNCSGDIHVTASGASNPSTDIPVNLLVSVNPILLVSPSLLTFNSQPGGGTPASQTVSVTSSSTQLLFTNSVNTGAGVPNFLTITQNNATTPASLTVAINSTVLAQLAANTYVNNIVLSSSGAGNPSTTIPVTLTVANTATLAANPTQITMNYQIGQAAPSTQTITVSSTGAPITFNAAATSTNCGGNFLSVSPTTSLSTLTASGQNGTQINVSANVSGLTAPVTCAGTITLTPTGSTTPTTVNVTLNVVNQAVINVGTNSITQIAASGSTTPITVIVPMSSTDNSTLLSFTATVSTNPPGQQWLSILGSNSLATPANLQVQLNPTNLASGQYMGTLTIQDLRGTGSAVPTQTIPVTLIVAAQVTANPTSLTFTTPLNGSNPANQTITVGGVPSTSTIGATPSVFSCGNASASWLTASVSGNTVIVGVVNTNLTVSVPTTCFGSVAINVPGAAPNPLNVPVTLNVTNATLSLSSGSLAFSYSAGSTVTPTSQTVQLTATGGGNVPFTATFTPTTTSTPAGLVTISPPSGTTTGATPTTLTIGLSQTALSTLGAGTFGGTVTVSSPNLTSVSASVTVAVTQPPPPVLTSIVNSATLQPGAVSPGEIITIFGTNEGPATPVNLTLTPAGKVATTLGNTQVFFDSFAAPLIYVSATQINAIVPYEIAGRTNTKVTINFNNTVSSGITLNVTDTSPGIFTLTQNGSGQGAILNQNNTVNGVTNPAPKGSVIVIYATGEGQLSPPGVTGSVTGGLPPFPKPPANTPVTLSFLVPNPGGGQPTYIPATLQYAGEAPTLVSGVLQVNAIVPSTVPSGPNTIVLMVGNNSSPSVVTVQVQ